MTSRALDRYWRYFTPELEVAPREPVDAICLVSAKGTPFTLVREVVAAPQAGRDLAWLIWREAACVGFVGGSVVRRDWDPFGAPVRPYHAGDRLDPQRAFAVWRTYLANGTERGTMREGLAPLPSRGLGIVSTAYVEIIRQLSSVGASLRSTPRARSREARVLWARLSATPGIEVVRGRSGTSRGYEFALMREPALAPTPGDRSEAP